MASDDLLLAQLDTMQMCVEDLSTKVSKLDDDLTTKVERLDHSVRGNGSPGLSTRVALLDNRVERCEQFILEVQSLRRWLSLGILSLLGSLAWRVVEWFLSHAS